MNALQRASIEKAGHDNGWEVTLFKDEASVTLGSSQHGGRVSVACDAAANGVVARFSSQECASELRRSFASLLFREDGACAVPGDQLPSLLARAAQLLRSLPTAPEEEYKKRLAETLNSDESILKTEAESVIKHRIGQNIFRQALMNYWGGRCAVTGVAVAEVLRASHCKPWADCTTDSERLDVYNGLLLTANLDALFDQGLITFTDQGEIIISDTLPATALPNLGVCKSLTLRQISIRHHPYLAYHRKNVFEKVYSDLN